MRKYRKNKQKAFTLAEVLVTLAVIGVVAALTIPSLTKSTIDTQNYVRWKKQYSIVSQSVKILQEENGIIRFDNASNTINDFMSIVKTVKTGTWGQLNGGYYNYYKNYSNGNNQSAYVQPAFTTIDGSVWAFTADDSNCAWTSAMAGTLSGKICAHVTIDVNGAQKPNMMGKDYFVLWIIKENGAYKVLPSGQEGFFTCIINSMSRNTSEGCSALALVRNPSEMP